MQEERFWALAGLKLSGEAGPDELAELDQYIADFPDMKLRLEVYSNIWRQKHAGLPVNQETAYNKHLQRLSNHLSKPALQYASEDGYLSEQQHEQQTNEGAEVVSMERPPSRKIWITLASVTAAAAAVLAVVFIGGPLTKPAAPGGNSAAVNTVSTRPGSRSKVQLPDGTQVWLNADSRLTYNQNFPGPIREVQLTGEAYFDVAKDKAHPFLIHTSTIDIQVLGTTFNVRSYDNEKNTETALFQGSVQVSLHNNPEQRILLKPNEKIIVQNNRLLVTGSSSTVTPPSGPAHNSTDEPLITLSKVHFQKKDSAVTETLWMRNQLAFEGASLDEVALQLERWYGIKVQITDDRLNNIHYTAVFEDESLPQVMEALRLSGNFNYRIHKKEVIITP